MQAKEKMKLLKKENFIMKPNLDKFNNFFPDFKFTEIEKSLEITIKNLNLLS